MDKWTSFPSPLKRKMILTALVGIGCLLVGIAFTVIAKDTMMLLLSVAVCAFSFYKAFAMFRIASKKDYEIVEGTCTAIVPKLLNKFRKIKITDDDGNEFNFEVIDAIESDEGRYLAMLPLFDDPEKMLQDSGELVIVKVGEENGEEYYYEIEDDDEYDFIADAFIERLEDFYEIAQDE